MERAQFQRFEAEEAVGKNNGWAGTIHARTQRPLLWLHQSHPVAASLSPRPHCHGLTVNLTRSLELEGRMASEREVLVEGFEERGEILKLKAQQQQDERLGYVPWEQMPAWFNAPGVSEQVLR